MHGNETEYVDDELSIDVYNTEKLPSGGAGVGSVYVKDRVMVDFQSYFEYGRRDALLGDKSPEWGPLECQCPACQGNDDLMALYRIRFDRANPDGRNWEPEQYLLCPPRVFGYVLREKQWAQLQVDCLKDIVLDNSTSWSEGLKLAQERTKNFIYDLVTGHGKPTDGDDGLEVQDIVERKGKGLVILLYGMYKPAAYLNQPSVKSPFYKHIADSDLGPPGVGKTSTAETVAIKAGKPLFAISVADVSTSAKHVESNLRRIFTLATTWQAILLM